MGLTKVATLILALAPVMAGAETLRLATWSPDLTRKGPGLLLRDIEKGDPQIDAAIRIIAAADADVLLLTGFDWDYDAKALTAFLARLRDAGIDYPHFIAEQPNSGIQSGLDLDQDGRFGQGEDALGYGRFTGVRGMVLLSRRPVELTRDLTPMLWRDLPDNIMPAVPDAIAEVQPLSSTAHWDIRIPAGSGGLSLLTLSATPPIFDGPEDRNGRRNHDEVALWLAEAPSDRWVVMGKINIDPQQGEGRRGALTELFRRTTSLAPQGPVAGTATADWGPDRNGDPRRYRVDYILPSSDLKILDAGIIWPTEGTLAQDAETASRYRLVWMDIDVP